MILQLVIGLLALAVASMLITQGRRRRIWSVLILAGLCIGVWFLLSNLNAAADGNFIYQWLPYNKLKADINISSSLPLREFFIPLIGLLVMMIYLNTISLEEQHSLRLNTILLLNFVALILMVSSRDFLQLMFAGSVFSVISFYTPDLILPKKKIFIFNFLAEMAVFMALAIVYGKTQSVSLADTVSFASKGWHKDLVAGLLLFAIGSKCGLFLLNDHYFSLRDTSFNRVLGIMVFSVPLSGLILLIKLHSLLVASSLSAHILPWWALFSCIICCISALINNHLKSKAIALALSLYAIIIFALYTDTSEFYQLLPSVLVGVIMISLIFGLAFRLSDGENYFIQPAGLWYKSKLSLLFSLGFGFCLAGLLASYFSQGVFLFFAFALMIILGLNLRILYFGERLSVISAVRRKEIWFYLPLLVGVGFFTLSYSSGKLPLMSYILFMAMIATFLCVPAKYLMCIGQMKIWHSDILFKIYEIIFIAPLRILGRILWLAFDIVVIERNIIGSISSILSVIVAGLQKLQEPKALNYILGIGLGILSILLYAGWYIYG